MEKRVLHIEIIRNFKNQDKIGGRDEKSYNLWNF